MTDWGKTAAEILSEIRQTRPLIHNITNLVVMNETANIILCLGALPVMAHAKEEVAEMASQAKALVLNIGTLDPVLIEAMKEAGEAANAENVPVILDPVGAGATTFRTKSARDLLEDIKIAAVRGNAAEITVLAGGSGKIVGVESVEDSPDCAEYAACLARKISGVAAVTGPVDLVTDGARTAYVHNGHPFMGRVTGTGCMSTAVVAGCLAVSDDAWEATASGLGIFGLAGEAAATGDPGPGTYHARLYDKLASLSPETITRHIRVTA